MSAEPDSPRQNHRRQNESTDDRPPLTDRIGSVVGDYLLEAVVGSGGMGVVYRARQGDTGRVVALKLMLPEVASNHRFRERFILEAQVAPQLDHPHIVPVFEIGEARGQLFIAMHLVEGPDLKEVIEREGALRVDRALRVIRQAAAALDHAHEQGMVHRDVKPQNFLLGKRAHDEEHVYLTDFGLVKPTSTESTASRTTDVFGSIQYMSPEQIEAMPIDGRADVYSLACVAFECLTGKPPFERPNEIALLWAHVHEEPPRATDVLAPLPGGVDLVLRQAMSKHPDDRYLTCGEFVDALEEGAKQHRRQLVAPVMRPLVKRIPRPKTEREVWAPNFFPELTRVRKLTDRPNWVVVTAVTAVLMLLAAALVQFSYEGGVVQAASDAGSAISDKVSDLAGSVSRLSDEPGGESPDDSEGDALADHSSTRSLTSDEAAGRRAGRLPGVTRGQPVVAQGSKGSGADQGEATEPIAPGEPKVVFVDAGVQDSFDGELFVANTRGGPVTRLTTTVAREGWPDWSPDGTKLAYTRSGTFFSGEIWVMDSNGSRARNLGICPEGGCFAVEWSPDGERLAFAREDKVFIATVSTKEVVSVPGLRGTGPSWSPDGESLVDQCDSLQEAVCIASLGTGQTRMIGAGSASRFAWAPVGDAIAFEANNRIATVAPDGSDYKVVSPSGPNVAGDTEPTWSGDGRVIAYSSREPADVVAINPDGSGFRRITLTAELWEVMPDWWGPSS